MKNCDGGILSPSTYSWWAAYLSNKRGFFLAPKYWIGHRQKVLFPSYFTSKIITYKKVLPSEYNKSIKNEKLFYPLFKYKK